ncbi:MAG: NAD(+)/NADH kinase [Chloroflexi bacterium]|nr:NAD(+)/NADH kinase [Chloroflexota bacterium]
MAIHPTRAWVGELARRVGILYGHYADTQELAQTLAALAQAHDVECWTAPRHEEAIVRDLFQQARPDLVVTMGGDGAMLQTVRLAAPDATPIVGVNFGTLGFLTEFQPDEIAACFPALLAGEYWLEERLKLEGEIWRDGQLAAVYEALNDVVMCRGALCKMVRVRVTIDDEPFTTYAADGVIVATPTGSTAYSFAAGGPILHPQLRSLVLTPVAPHLILSSSWVLSSEVQVGLELVGREEGTAAIDGQIHEPLRPGDRVHVRASRQTARFVRRRPPTYFYGALLERIK